MPLRAGIASLVLGLSSVAAHAGTIAYGEALDYGDRKLFLDCFTPDADYIVEMRLGGKAASPTAGATSWPGTSRATRMHQPPTTSTSPSIRWSTAMPIPLQPRVTFCGSMRQPRAVRPSFWHQVATSTNWSGTPVDIG